MVQCKFVFSRMSKRPHEQMEPYAMTSILQRSELASAGIDSPQLSSARLSLPGVLSFSIAA